MPSLLPKRNYHSALMVFLVLGIGPLGYLVVTHTRLASQREEGKVLVVATTGMIGDAVARIGKGLPAKVSLSIRKA